MSIPELESLQNDSIAMWNLFAHNGWGGKRVKDKNGINDWYIRAKPWIKTLSLAQLRAKGFVENEDYFCNDPPPPEASARVVTSEQKLHKWIVEVLKTKERSLDKISKRAKL